VRTAPRMLVVKGVPSAATADAGMAAAAAGGGDGVAAELRYNLPESLTSFKVEAKMETKALTLVALLDDLAHQATICFTACARSPRPRSHANSVASPFSLHRPPRASPSDALRRSPDLRVANEGAVCRLEFL
jgi:hypothetical protein